MKEICPKEWENCLIVPIFKKGNKNDPNDYRGITLINTMQKLLSKILAHRLQNMCSEFNLLIKEQAGFIKSEECVSEATALLECCQRRKIRNKETILCFLDLKKAYDMVPHRKLFTKLKHIGFGPKFVKVIESMYSNTKIRVKIGSETS